MEQKIRINKEEQREQSLKELFSNIEESLNQDNYDVGLEFECDDIHDYETEVIEEYDPIIKKTLYHKIKKE